MKTHLIHVSSGFTAAGCIVKSADYHAMAHFCGMPLPEKYQHQQRQKSLEKMVRTFQPDMIFFAGSCKFDIPRLKSYWNGIPVFHDYDGPRRNTPEDFVEISKNCVLVTVSRYIEQEVKKQGTECFYLPHGVDTEFYHPEHGTRQNCTAPCSCIGRATPRRIEICSVLKNDIVLYGDRWKKTQLAGNCKLKRNVREKELVSIYRDSGMMLNVLQEGLDTFQTIPSLQCFAVPATAGCLCAEYVLEFPELFESGKEILTFRSKEELPDLLEKVKRSPDWAKNIGEAGRKRCLAEHTHTHRAKALLKMLS